MEEETFFGSTIVRRVLLRATDGTRWFEDVLYEHGKYEAPEFAQLKEAP